MPQFDLFCYSTQVFWSLTTFYTFYIFFLNNYIPFLMATIKVREKGKRIFSQKAPSCLYTSYINSFILD